MLTMLVIGAVFVCLFCFVFPELRGKARTFLKSEDGLLASFLATQSCKRQQGEFSMKRFALNESRSWRAQMQTHTL